MKIFNTFHMSMVRTYRGNGVPGQAETNDDVRANRGRKVVQTDDSMEMDE
jgi:hypothetical protein